MASSFILFRSLELSIFLFFIKFKKTCMSFLTNTVDVTSIYSFTMLSYFSFVSFSMFAYHVILYCLLLLGFLIVIVMYIVIFNKVISGFDEVKNVPVVS